MKQYTASARRPPKVSIGMAIFNDEQYVQEALDSLLAQSFTDFELIISDNASTDRTGDVCQAYAARDPRLRYIRHAENRGQAENFNFLLREARGDWFMWAASDDIWDTEFIRSLLRRVTSDSRYVGGFSPYVFTDERGAVMGSTRVYDYSSRARLSRLIKLCLHYDDGCFYGLYRKRCIENVRVPKWWWINAKSPFNIAYPVLFYLLSVGDLALVGSSPLWFNRLKSNARHFVPYSRWKFGSYLAFLLRQINVFYECERSIYRATGSLGVVLVMFPFLSARLAYNSVRPLVTFIAMRLRKTFGFSGAV